MKLFLNVRVLGKQNQRPRKSGASKAKLGKELKQEVTDVP